MNRTSRTFKYLQLSQIIRFYTSLSCQAFSPFFAFDFLFTIFVLFSYYFFVLLLDYFSEILSLQKLAGLDSNLTLYSCVILIISFIPPSSALSKPN